MSYIKRHSRAFSLVALAGILLIGSLLLSVNHNSSPDDCGGFERARSFSSGLAAVRIDGKWGYVNKKGDLSIPPQYEFARNFSQGRGFVQSGDRWGYINTAGETIVPYIYEDSGEFGQFSSGLAAVRRENKWGYIDRHGNLVIPMMYEEAYPFSEGFGLVRSDTQYGFIGKDNSNRLPFIYTDASSFSNKLAAVKRNGYWGYVNVNGKYSIPPLYNWASPFVKGLAWVQRSNLKIGIIDSKSRKRASFRYDFVQLSRSKLTLVKENGLYGYIDRSGKQRIKPQYKLARPFSEGKAAVNDNGQWGFIDHQNEYSVTPSFDAARSFSEGLAAVKKGKGWCYIDQNGEVTISGSDTTVEADDFRVPPGPGSSKYYESRVWYNQRGKQKNSWKLMREATGRKKGLYEVTQFPFTLPSADQLEAAERLRERSLQVAHKRGWFDYKNGRRDGYRLLELTDGIHYNNFENIYDRRVLNPRHPEVLMYYDTPDGKKLAGFMFLVSERLNHGPQIGGQYTRWHYHITPEKYCFKTGLLPYPASSAAECDDGVYTRRGPEMLHVWFVEHPDGFFATKMKLSNAVRKQLTEESYPPKRFEDNL